MLLDSNYATHSLNHITGQVAVAGALLKFLADSPGATYSQCTTTVNVSTTAPVYQELRWASQRSSDISAESNRTILSRRMVMLTNCYCGTDHRGRQSQFAQFAQNERHLRGSVAPLKP